MGFQLTPLPELDKEFDLDKHLEELIDSSERLDKFSSEVHSNLEQDLISPETAIAFAHRAAGVCAGHVSRMIRITRLLNKEIEKIKTYLDLP